MTERSTGRPAFPNAAFPSTRNEQQGVTLRDYFAAKAMAHYLSRTSDWATVATHAYAMADAMLEMRKTERSGAAAPRERGRNA